MQSDGTPVCSGGRQKKRMGLVAYGKPFTDLKTPLEGPKVIYDLLKSEFEFDMLVFLLILLGRTATRLLYFKRNNLHQGNSCRN